MFARRKRCLSVASESSEDDPPQHSRQLRASTHAKSVNNWPLNRSSKRPVERQATNNINNDHKLIVQRRKKQKSLVSTTKESPSNKLKKMYNREGAVLKTFNEYKTEDGVDKTSGSSGMGSQQKESLQAKEESVSSSENRVVRRSSRSRKKQSDLFSSTDSTNSAIPEFSRQRKGTKSTICIVESDSGNSSDCVIIEDFTRNGRSRDSSDCEVVEEVTRTGRPDDSSDCELIEEVTRSVRPAEGHNDPTTSRFGPVRQRGANPFTYRNNTQIALPYSRLNSNHRRTRRIPVFQNIENFRSGFPFVSISSIDDTSSSRDSDDNLPIFGQRFIAAFLNENNGLLNSSISTTQPEVVPIEAVLSHKTSSSKKMSCSNSSESEEESEKCPICLVQFGSQEVGVPGSCTHRFCLCCIQEWAKINNICPVDRKRFNLMRVLNDAEDRVVREIKIETPLERAMGDDWWEVFALINNVYEESGTEENINNFNSDCLVCHNTSDFEDMLMCECCNNVYHINCINPPPTTSSLWMCPECCILRSIPFSSLIESQTE